MAFMVAILAFTICGCTIPAGAPWGTPTLDARAPLRDLLTGSEGTIYKIVLEGGASAAQTRFASLPWVSGIKAKQLEIQTTWQVSVTDEAAAKSDLLIVLFVKDKQGRRKIPLDNLLNLIYTSL